MPEGAGQNFDVNNCDLEPIHIPGTAQPFGCILAGSLALDTVDYASDNTHEFLGRSTVSTLGSSFLEVLGEDVCHDIRNALSYGTSKTQRGRVGRYTIGDIAVEIYAHVNTDNLAVIEFEHEVPPSEKSRDKPIDKMRVLLARAATEETVDLLLRTATIGLFALTGYDRVKAYRFAEDGSGEVVAEARGPNVDSFLGLRYPAWDIPTQARALQVKNPIRLLSDIAQTPIPILAHEKNAEPLELSLAHARGCSPIHVQYLKNMGVGGTLTLSLVIEGKLWGMFALHHMSPRVVSSDTRIAAELFAQLISLLIQEKLTNEQSKARTDAAEARRAILADTDATTDLLHAFPSIAKALHKVIECDGLAILREGKLQTDGSVPSNEAIHAIAGREHAQEDMIAETDFLEDTQWHNGTDLAGVGGCLHVRSSASHPLQLLFFRDERARQVTWAGKPQKELEESEYGPRITPRGSFAAYIEEQRGRCEPWGANAVTSARELQTMLTQIASRSDRAQLSRQKEMVSHQRQQELMIAELNHRVKNILALIRSLSRQAKASSASLESYATALEQRIAALSAAHDLAVSDAMIGVSIRSIFETEVSPYQSDDNQQAVLSGPLIGLRADVAPMIALVVHEVVSNAAKYGALSTPEGIVRARWSITEEGWLDAEWREMSGPPVVPPTRHGFGRSLIERAIPYEFDGSATLEYNPEGVQFRFSLPPDTLVDLTEETQSKLVGKVGTMQRAATEKHVLLVEDNLVLAMDMVEAMTRLGAEGIETAGTIEAAIRLLNTMSFDLAVLDLNLRGVVSFEIAERLMELNIPFVFVTGYGSSVDVPPAMRGVPILTKPVDDATLSEVITTLCADA